MGYSMEGIDDKDLEILSANFNMDLNEWTKKNPFSSRKTYIDLKINMLENEDDLSECGYDMLKYLYYISR